MVGWLVDGLARQVKWKIGATGVGIGHGFESVDSRLLEVARMMDLLKVFILVS
jgi:hypothetical protein